MPVSHPRFPRNHSSGSLRLVLALSLGLFAPVASAQRTPAPAPHSNPKVEYAEAGTPESAKLPPPPLAASGSLDKHPELTTTSGTNVTSLAGREALATVEVRAIPSFLDTKEGYERRISPRELEQSAGTFGDPARFMQMLPGVVSDNDQRNDFIVRGGNPSETLFMIDNIEMPSINQLALSDTTGGFVSMLDNNALRGTILHSDAYDSKFDQRLSAVVEMTTIPDHPIVLHRSTDLGIGGMGTSFERPFRTSGSIFFSVRRSVLNLVTNDIGMNGVPIYNNSLLRADGRVNDKNNWWMLSLTGVDSMNIHPTPTDGFETNPFDIRYSGWRNTTGINWQHVFSAESFGVLSLSNSEQKQTTHETDQLLNDEAAYSEQSHDGITTLKYDWTLSANSKLTITAGGRLGLDRLKYAIGQPIPLANPYSIDPSPQVTLSVDRQFAAASSAVYGQAQIELPHRMRIVVGERISQWAIVGSTAATGKAVFFVPIAGRMFHVGYSQYGQLPPSLYLLAFNNQQVLKPIHTQQVTAGVQLIDARHLRVTVNAYQKNYSKYPVAVNFPQLTMADIADTFGQAFLMFPMTSRGLGLARGVETAADWLPVSRLTMAGTFTYMRSWYSGLDGVMRKGNFDIPAVANVSGTADLGHGWVGSFRYSASTGKPYTPDDMALSTAQSRDVYDLTKINGLRASMYSRLDFRVEWTRPVGKGTMNVHIGLENALNKKNFYSYQWMPRLTDGGTLPQNQMPMFPDLGLRFSF